MKKKLLLSLALAATLMTSATAAEALSKNARTLPANEKMKSVKVMSKLNDAPQLKTKTLSSENVVLTKSLKNGDKINYVKGADGMVRKQLVTDDAQRINTKRHKAATVKATAPSYYQNFSGYDGATYDWIPANWQDITKADNVAPGADTKKLNLTWAVTEPIFDTTPDGKYYARCQVSIPNEETGEVLKTQDEWLITESLPVKTNENLYFYLGYKPGWTLLDVNTMTFTTQNNLLEVHVSDDGGTTWTKQWDNLADAKSYTEDELWDDLMAYNCSWIFVPVDLKAYEGKNIKVAFRYVGIDGESVCIDALSIGTANPVASYRLPIGFYYWGLSDVLGGYNKFAIGSAYAESTWINRSSLDSETFNWDYVDPFTDKPAVSNDKFLSLFYPFAQTDGITLTASAEGATDSEYTGISLVQAGASASFKDVDYGACTYDVSQGGLTRASYFGNKGDANWARALGLTGDDKASVTALSNVFEKPAHSYFLSKVWIHSTMVADPTAEFTLTIKKLTDDNTIGDVIATTTCFAGDAIVTGDFSVLPFTFKIKDPITGLEEDGIFTIDSAIYIELTGFKSEKVTEFYPVWIDEVSDNTDVYSYVSLDITQAGVTKTKLYTTDVLGFAGETGNTIYCTSFMFNTDATFTWFESEEDTFKAPNEGGSKTFDVNAYYYSAGWAVEEEDEGTLPEWITYATDDDSAAQTSTLTFTVEPLPTGVEGRSFDVTMSIPGTKKVYKISQGVSGVNDAVVNSIKVANVGGDFAVTYPATVNAVKIFNIAGQLVKDIALTDAGSTVIPAQELAKGIYIMQFNDNQKIKVIK